MSIPEVITIYVLHLKTVDSLFPFSQRQLSLLLVKTFLLSSMQTNSALSPLFVLEIVLSGFYTVLSPASSRFLTHVHWLGLRWNLMKPTIDFWLSLSLCLSLFLFISLQLFPLQYFFLWILATLVSLDSMFTLCPQLRELAGLHIGFPCLCYVLGTLPQIVSWAIIGLTWFPYFTGFLIIQCFKTISYILLS